MVDIWVIFNGQNLKNKLMGKFSVIAEDPDPLF